MEKKYFWGVRLLGKGFLFSGFLLALYSLSQSSQFLVDVSLGLLVIGIVMMAASVYHVLKSRGTDKGPSEWMRPRS
ncbi:MAG: hypothetical protein L0Y56_03345 [Nitrospira sp.]|nr:hypothetical protein [Nitrospira sp.]